MKQKVFPRNKLKNTQLTRWKNGWLWKDYRQNLSQYWEHQHPITTSHNPWRKEKDNHTYIYYQNHLYCLPEQTKPWGRGRGRKDRGRSPLMLPARGGGGGRVGKNKGELTVMQSITKPAHMIRSSDVLYCHWTVSNTSHKQFLFLISTDIKLFFKVT